jgi:hypothetical protein
MISGKNIIFLISQPRSGSSLLQQMLNMHSAITTLPEPWIMLPLIYTYKYPGIESDYNSYFANKGFHDYLGRFRNGAERYQRYLKDFALRIYALAVEGKGHVQYFLDKTPRYYHIIEELSEMFENAKFIILIRNPLSVFASILSYNFKGDLIKYLASQDRQCDLFVAPQKLVEFKKQNPMKGIEVHYEDLVRRPERELNKIYEYLGIESPRAPAQYTVDDMFQETTSIDTKSVHRHRRPVTRYLESWKASIDDTQKKQIAIEYIEKLGRDLIEELGYSYQRIMTSLLSHRALPARVHIPLSMLMRPAHELSIKGRLKLKVLTAYYKAGLGGFLKRKD